MGPHNRRLSSAVFVRVALILALCAATIYWSCTKFRKRVARQTSDTAGSSNLLSAAPDKELTKKFFEFEAQQNQMDQTVWATELLAEKYEDVFIKLWDNLRTNDDAFAVVENF